MDLSKLVDEILAFRDARDWKQFHSPNHLAAAIAIEASELQEHFLWKSPAQVKDAVSKTKERKEIENELADILIFSLLFANAIGVDPGQAIVSKLKINEAKYPVGRSKGRATKYNKLQP